MPHAPGSSEKFDRTKRNKTTAAAPAQPIEITLCAEYSAEWDDKPKLELATIEAKGEEKWHPSLKDFLAVAQTPNKARPGATIIRTVARLSHLIGAISCSDTEGKKERGEGTVRRVNLITHADSGVYSLSGRVDSTGSCSIGRPSAVPLEDRCIDEKTLEWLNDHPKGQLYRAMLRKVLSADAEIWLFLCWGAKVGPSSNLARRLAETLGRTVCAFTDEVRYWPDHDLSPPMSCSSSDDAACVEGRNKTSIGKSGVPGRGFTCLAKVPDAFAGRHMCPPDRFSPGTPESDAE